MNLQARFVSLLARRDIRGLGDVIADLLKTVGIEGAVKWLENQTGLPCGCAERQEWLNEHFPVPVPGGRRGEVAGRMPALPVVD